MRSLPTGAYVIEGVDEFYRCGCDLDADLAAPWPFHWTSAGGMDSVAEQETSLRFHAVVVSVRLDTTDAFCAW